MQSTDVFVEPNACKKEEPSQQMQLGSFAGLH
jgi:hypothetical protein